MLSVKNLVKVYQSKNGNTKVVALNGVSIDFPETGLVFLLGKSGSGKSTLLNTIGGLDSFDSGEIIIKGKSSKDFSQSDFDSYRNTFIGFIFQEYNILENFTVQKNLALAIELQGKKPNKSEIENLLKQVDMLEYAKRKPNELSGGQKQRVAIARALIKNPEIIMADEPTGALDSNTGKQVMETLKELSKDKLVIIVSHDQDFAEKYGDRIIELKDGKIIRDVTKKEVLATKTESGISIVEGRYIHIKKGQQISQEDLNAIAKQIINNSKENDTIISLDKSSNTTIKKTEGITDSGNQETFLETQKEDIHKKDYNGNDLKLIKSRLKFSDSFKMGASSLKSKVSKLVFTTILAVFAFTLFGVVDAFSCWSRANSTWQAYEASNLTTVAGVKEISTEDYNRTTQTTESDLNSLRSEFSDYTIKGVLGSYYSSFNSLTLYDSTDSYVELSSVSNIFWNTVYSGFISLTQTELDNLEFTLEGTLPSNDDEICISKHLWDCIKKANTSITSWSGYKIHLNLSTQYVTDNLYTIVGIIDDGTDLSKYEQMTDSELSENYYTIIDSLYYSYTNLIYLSENIYEKIYDKGTSTSYIYLFSETDYGSERVSYSRSWFELSDSELEWFNQSKNNENGIYEPEDYVTYTKDDYIKEYLTYYIGGDTSTYVGLSDNEIIIPEWVANNYYSNIEDLIENGFYIYIGQTTQESAIELKVVGVGSYECFIFNDDFYAQNIAELFKGYGFVLTKLNGSSSDETLVKTFETYNADGIRFTIQYEATDTLDMFESLLTVMTSALLWVAIALAVFAGLLLINFISTSINYKKREIGVLRALGARGSDVFGIFFNESMVIAFINFVISAVLTFVVCSALNQMFISEMGMNIYLLSFSTRQVLLILAISVLVAFLASLIPVSKISRKKPIDAINNR